MKIKEYEVFAGFEGRFGTVPEKYLKIMKDLGLLDSEGELNTEICYGGAEGQLVFYGEKRANEYATAVHGNTTIIC